jgi:hypothetical protein
MALPETSEEPHFEKSSFRVKGKIFATVPEGGNQLHIFVTPDEARALIAEDPVVFEEIRWGKKVADSWVRVNLAKADRTLVCELLEDAWRLKAPKRVVASFDAERNA